MKEGGGRGIRGRRKQGKGEGERTGEEMGRLEREGWKKKKGVDRGRGGGMTEGIAPVHRRNKVASAPLS